MNGDSMKINDLSPDEADFQKNKLQEGIRRFIQENGRELIPMGAEIGMDPDEIRKLISGEEPIPLVSLATLAERLKQPLDAFIHDPSRESDQD